MALLAGAIYVVQHEFRHLRVADIRLAMAAIPGRALLLAAVWTVLSYGVLTFYDRLATIYAGHRVAFRRTAFASFCAYALAHNLGFSALSGAAVRYRLYAHWGLSPVQIAKVVAFCSLTFALGGLVLGGAILFCEPGVVPLLGRLLPHWVMWAAGGAMWAVVGAYIALSQVVGRVRMMGHEVLLPGARMAVVQVLLATVDVAVTAAIFFSLLPHAEGLTFLAFLAIYVSSYTAGLAANLPGGIGVFDTAILLGLAPYLPASVAMGAVVVFRLYYYVIPLFLAGSMFAGNELVLRGRALVALPQAGAGVPGEPGAVQGAAPGGGPARVEAARWSEPDFAAAAATGVLALCGALLLGLGLIDSRADFSWIDPDFAGLASNAGQYVPSLFGAALLVIALALSRRVTLAWGAAIGLLLAAAADVAAQGEPLWVPGVLVLAVLLVAPFRDAYYRHARLLGAAAGIAVVLPLLVLAGCAAALAAMEPQVRYLAQNSWWEIMASPELPGRLRAGVAAAVGLGALAGWALLRPGDVEFLPWDAAGRDRYAALGQGQAGPAGHAGHARQAGPAGPAEADGLVLGEAGRSAIAFRRTGHVLLGLGDPAGAESDRVSAIWRLRDLAQQEGRDLAVWGAGVALLPVYGGLGLAPLPLGPDGAVHLEADAVRTERALYCVAGRDLDELLPLLPGLQAGLVASPAADESWTLASRPAAGGHPTGRDGAAGAASVPGFVPGSASGAAPGSGSGAAPGSGSGAAPGSGSGSAPGSGAGPDLAPESGLESGPESTQDTASASGPESAVRAAMDTPPVGSRASARTTTPDGSTT